MKKIMKQLYRFSIIGAAAFMMDYGLLFLFTETLRMHYLLSSMLSFTIATVFNYAYSTKYVFQCSQEQSRAGQFTVFVVLSACGLFLNALLMKYLVEQAALYYMWAKLISGVLVSVWNFVSRKMMLEETVRERLSERRKRLFQD